MDHTDFFVKVAYKCLMGEDLFANFWTLKTLPSTHFFGLEGVM